MRFLKGEPDYDLLQGWGLFKTNLRQYHASTTHSTFAPGYRDAPSNLCHAHWLYVSYDAATPDALLEKMTNQLEEKLPGCLLDATSTADAIAVFIYKPTQHNIRARLKL